MKISEIIQKLLLCPQDYEVAVATVEELDGGFQVRLDSVINQIFRDDNEKEILFFTTNNRIEINHDGVTEVIVPEGYQNGTRQSFDGPPISMSPIYDGVVADSMMPMNGEPAYQGQQTVYATQMTPAEVAADQMRQEFA